MTAAINALRAEEALKQNLKNDADILKSAGTLVRFASGLAIGEPVTLASCIAELSVAASSAISGSVALISRLGGSQEHRKEFKSPYDRFCLLYFVTCQRCYIEALNDYLSELGSIKLSKNVSDEQELTEKRTLRNQVQVALANLNEAEVSFRFGVDPMAADIPLFNAFDSWLSATLEYFGYTISSLPKPVKTCSKRARERFRVWIAQDKTEAQWMRTYLALTREDSPQKPIEELGALNEVLTSWVEISKKNERKRAELWLEYKKSLEQLPDQKETMFNEHFGVRKVFVSPLATYHIAGVPSDIGEPAEVSDLGRVLGALLSTRIKSDDLIILCGGPGSGKSTLCRMLASQLASNQQVHPVFIRLRRLKEGADVANFVEELMRKEGLIERTSDIKEIPNLILILDGFDELVMASRTRLRQFFNAIREDHSSGILRNAKIVISGRDTLFPKGEGLPSGSHVLNLIPFDQARVKLWGGKWRSLDPAGKGSTFFPEDLLPENLKRSTKKSPLHHLLTWPLTLHLVARVHTAGRLTINKDNCDEIEKAYLYRSILANTAARQLDQAEGKGRLDTKQMRRFLQALAWEMHTRAVDCMDVTDVMPILRQFFPNNQDGDLVDLAEVAVVNSPELTKGEETGFEFVHKSFAEYLAAEQMAIAIEESTFKVEQFMSEGLTWRMSESEAASKLASIFGIRLITDEVQEMLEPMLGGIKYFLEGEGVSDRVDSQRREDGLGRITARFESLLHDALLGKFIDAVTNILQEKTINPLESYSNFCAGLVIAGSASARAQSALDGHAKVLFNVNPFENAFWRLVSVLAAGGMTLDNQLSARLFEGTSAAPKSKAASLVGDISIPFKLSNFKIISGYTNSAEECIEELFLQLCVERLKDIFVTVFSKFKGVYSMEPNKHLMNNELVNDRFLHKYGSRVWHDHSEIDSAINFLSTRLGLMDERTARNLLMFWEDIYKLKAVILEGGIHQDLKAPLYGSEPELMDMVNNLVRNHYPRGSKRVAHELHEIIQRIEYEFRVRNTQETYTKKK